MMQRVKKGLLALVCAVVLSLGATGCDGIIIGVGGGDEPGTTINASLVRCWHLKSFCAVPTDVDIYIDFAVNGKFKIYQRTEELGYTVFAGTYTIDEENSLLEGVYDDGIAWASSYYYTIDEEAKELELQSVEKPLEVAVYEESKVPASADSATRTATVTDVKPL